MDDKTLYTKILGIKPPWFIARVEINEKQNRIDIWIDHEYGIRVRCPICEKFYGVYDHSPERTYRHLDTCQMSTFIHVRLPRVNCPEHGIKRVESEYGENDSDMTFAFESHIIRLIQECSMLAASRISNLSWDRCWNVLIRAVNRGRMRKPHKIPERIGIDEKSFSRGHKYETLVYDLDAATVEYVGDDRIQESLERYYQQFDPEELVKVKAVAMDMWAPYISATKGHIPGAEKKIVFDRFHVMRHVVDAVDQVRKEEHKLLVETGEQTLKGTKYLWLYSHENIPEWRKEEFETLRKKDLRICRAWAIKENLRHMWNYRYAANMQKYFNKWYFWATHSRLEPVKKAAKTVKRHIDNIVTYAKHRITNALAEGMNAKIEKIKRIACGYRNRSHYRAAIYFHCGGLDLHPRPPIQPSLSFRSLCTQHIGGTH